MQNKQLESPASILIQIFLNIAFFIDQILFDYYLHGGLVILQPIIDNNWSLCLIHVRKTKKQFHLSSAHRVHFPILLSWFKYCYHDEHGMYFLTPRLRQCWIMTSLRPLTSDVEICYFHNLCILSKNCLQRYWAMTFSQNLSSLKETVNSQFVKPRARCPRECKPVTIMLFANRPWEQ